MSVVNTATGEIVEPLSADESARLRVKEHAFMRGGESAPRLREPRRRAS